MAKHKVVLIPGDGIGPAISVAVKRVLASAGADIDWEEHLAGLTALEKHGEVLPDRTLDAVRHHQLALKGPCTTPIGGGFSSVNVALRRSLDLYAAVRPVRNLPGVESRFDDVSDVSVDHPAVAGDDDSLTDVVGHDPVERSDDAVPELIPGLGVRIRVPPPGAVALTHQHHLAGVVVELRAGAADVETAKGLGGCAGKAQYGHE